MERKNISGLGKILAIASLAGLPLVAGCEKREAEYNPEKDNVTIKVGEGRYIDNLFIVNCRMNNKETFSLGVNPFNYYYPADAKQIHFHWLDYDRDYEVIKVTPEQITLRPVRK